MRILIVSGEAYPGHEKRCLPLARRLIEMGYSIRHRGPGWGMYNPNGFKRTTFGPEFLNDPDAKFCNTKLFESWDELWPDVLWSDIVVLTTNKDCLEIAPYVHEHGRRVVQIRDQGGNEPWVFDPIMLAVGSRWEAERFHKLSGIPRDRIAVTGRVQFDLAAAQHRKMDRSAFCKKYGLDEARKICVYLGDTPAAHRPKVREFYGKVRDVIEKTSNFNLIYKPHPREHAGVKMERHYADTKTPTWVQNIPGVAACEPKDKYDCFGHADLFLSRFSGTFYETALFRKPMIFVDTPEFYLEIEDLDASYFKHKGWDKRFSGIARREFNHLGFMGRKIDQIEDDRIRELLQKFDDQHDPRFPTGRPEYIGGECALEELGEILTSGAYEVKDESIFDDYLDTYCFDNDGKAHERVADVVDVLAREWESRKRQVLNVFKRPFEIRRLRQQTTNAQTL